MSDLSITAANVVKGATALTRDGTAGATITAGMCVYYNSATSKWLIADATSSTKANCGGIALNGASDGQPLQVLVSGPVTIGATVGIGTVYCVADDPGTGKICPNADMASEDYITVLGIATTDAIISVDINASGVAIPT